MTPSAQPPERSPADQLREIRQQFESAWQQALSGGEQPCLENYLAAGHDTARTVLRDELELIDRTYRQSFSAIARTLDLPPPDRPQPTSPAPTFATIVFPGPPGTASPRTVGADDGFSFDGQWGEEPSKPQVRLPGYQILGTLGAGGMGVVYKARHLKLGRVVALKMLLAGAHARPETLARFQTESRAVAQLQHPNIVQIYEVGEHDGLPYFSLEFVDGGDLARKAGGQPQPAREAARVVETLARAVAHAHQHGVVHRDLKPGNVLLTANGIPKIADFGLAKRLQSPEASSQTRSGTLMGTPNYMAPEQARGDFRDAGPPADIYSLGAILYVLLTGRPPFQGATVAETILQVAIDEPVPPSRTRPEVPRDLESVCLKCLQKEPGRRYPSALALAEDLHRFQAGEPTLARPVGTPERLWRWVRRHPALAAMTAAIAALLVTVAVGSAVFAVALAWAGDEKERQRRAAVEARELADRRADELEAARGTADANARLANEQAGLALDTLSTLLVSVRQNLKDSPGTQRLKQAFARDALEKLRQIEPAVAQLPRADLSRAEAHRFLGTIYLELGRVKEARPHFEQCHEILDRLAADDPGPAGSRGLTVAYNALGDFELLTGNTAAAREQYMKALNQRREAFDAEPGQAHAKVDLATSYVKVGNASEPGEALRYYKEALKLRKELEDAAEPRNTALRRDVWIACNFLGDACLRLKDTETALDYYRQGLQRAEKLVEISPRGAGFKHALGISHEKLGTAQLRAGRGQLAQEHYAKALDLIRPLARDDPDNLALLANLVLLLARSGAHAEAAALALDLLRLAPQYANNLYNAGCCYALCAAAAGAGKADDQLTAQEKDLRKRYAEAALKALDDAVNQGFCNLTLLRTDPDLDPVRGEPAFASLAKKLQAVN